VLQADVLGSMRPASGGFATSVWRVETARQSYALRVFRADQRHVLEREMAVLRQGLAAGLPVPRVDATGSYEERPAMLTEWCSGRPLLEALQAEPWRIVQLGMTFGRLQRRMHRVLAPEDLRSDWMNWPRACAPHVAKWLSRLRLVSGRLLHLDYHPLNVLASGGQMTAIIDWTNAHAGDPRADIARTLTILRLPPPGAGINTVQRVALAVFEVAWRAGYGPFGANMAAFYAWAGGAMLADLEQRYQAAELEHVARWTARWRRLA
jgi:aminoglycoside phosphotransferase (APT) family kinase protein